MLKTLGHGSTSSTLSAYAFQRKRKHVETEINIFLDNTKRSMIFRRLNLRLKQPNFTTFDEYADRIEGSADERIQFLSLLKTKLTSFFRKKYHFGLMAKEWQSRLLDNARFGNQIRMWRSACSSNQEAYSLAITVLESCPNENEFDAKILATDADKRMVETTSKGIYTRENLENMSPVLRKKYFTPNELNQDTYAIRDTVKSLISFSCLNIIREWQTSKMHDLMFCRNVAIYFKEEVQLKLWADMATQMNKSGFLCIGHSERAAGPARKSLTSLGKTAYVQN